MMSRLRNWIGKRLGNLGIKLLVLAGRLRSDEDIEQELEQ